MNEKFGLKKQLVFLFWNYKLCLIGYLKGLGTKELGSKGLYLFGLVKVTSKELGLMWTKFKRTDQKEQRTFQDLYM